MRPEFAVLIVIAFSAVAVGAAYFVTQDGVLSKSRHEWRLEITPRAAGPWSVEVPRLVAGPNATEDDRASLSGFLQELGVDSGDAQVQLKASTLRIVGDGNATVLASRTSGRGDESFVHWADTGRAVSRADDTEGPVLRVTWSVAFSAGGRACTAASTNSVDLAKGEVRTFPEPIGRGGSDDDPNRPALPLWKNVCT